MKHLWKRFFLFAHSIRFRLVMWFTLILALVLFVFSALIYLRQLKDIRGETSFRLEQKLEDVLRYTQLINGQIMLPNGLLAANDVLVLLDADGNILASTGNVPAGQVVGLLSQNRNLPTDPDHDVSQPIIFGEISNYGHYALILRSARDLFGKSYTAVLGTPFDTYGLVGRLTLTLLFGNLLTLAIAIAGGFWLADRAMRPVHAITHTARTISETDLSRRINSHSKDELGELASTFDAMLARLETAFQRQRQFVADASHELRTPLTIVNLETSRALAAKRTPQEYQRAVRVIQSENELMTNLVNDLLTLARMDSGQTALEKTEVDLGDIALEAIERLENLAARRHVRLEAGELSEAPLQGNRQLLLQLVSNLIENGIKYTSGEDKFVRVEIETGGETARLRVTDNGRGIPAEHLPHLFDRFYRADQARARDESDDAPGGTGLGLSIVQSIVQAHGGEIHVTSIEQSGTTFEVIFRLQ